MNYHSILIATRLLFASELRLNEVSCPCVDTCIHFVTPAYISINRATQSLSVLTLLQKP